MEEYTILQKQSNKQIEIMKTSVFWKDGFDGSAKGGIYYRSFDLNKFIKKVEASETGGEVVGIKFEDNNLELIINTTKES